MTIELDISDEVLTEIAAFMDESKKTVEEIVDRYYHDMQVNPEELKGHIYDILAAHYT